MHHNADSVLAWRWYRPRPVNIPIRQVSHEMFVWILDRKLDSETYMRYTNFSQKPGKVWQVYSISVIFLRFFDFLELSMRFSKLWIRNNVEVCS
jgi:hypothetical protein